MNFNSYPFHKLLECPSTAYSLGKDKIFRINGDVCATMLQDLPGGRVRNSCEKCEFGTTINSETRCIFFFYFRRNSEKLTDYLQQNYPELLI